MVRTFRVLRNLHILESYKVVFLFFLEALHVSFSPIVHFKLIIMYPMTSQLRLFLSPYKYPVDTATLTSLSPLNYLDVLSEIN